MTANTGDRVRDHRDGREGVVWYCHDHGRSGWSGRDCFVKFDGERETTRVHADDLVVLVAWKSS